MVTCSSLRDTAINILSKVLKCGLVRSLLFSGISVFVGCLVSVILSDRRHDSVHFKQPSQYLAPSNECADLVFLWLLL